MLDNSPKVSVIIPIYNVEKYLRKCLDSVIQQTYSNLEIICIDDGSPDNCGAIIDEYAQKDKRVIVIHQKNSGVSTARNRGLDIATGDYITFVDPDDWIEPHCYESAIKVFQNDKTIDLVQWAANIINNRTASEQEYQNIKYWHRVKFSGKLTLTLFIVKQMLYSPCCNLFKAEIIKDLQLKYSDFCVAEDVLFIAMYNSKVRNIYFIPELLYNYVLHDTSTMKKHVNNPISLLETYINITLNCYDFYKQQNLETKFNRSIFYKFNNNVLYALSLINFDKKASELLTNFVAQLPQKLYWGEEIKYIRNKEFYKIKQLNIPWLVKGNKNFGLKIYKYENPKIIISILGLKISLHYQKLLSVKNINNRKVFNILGLKIKVSKQKKFSEYLKKLLRKIFSIYNEYKNNKKYKIINILGIRIKHTINLEKKYIKFAKKNYHYILRKDKSVKRRLFLTTGNLSLINSLTIIKQINEPNCEDTLLIYSNMKNTKFDECCRKIAGIHKFENIHTLYTSNNDFREYFIKNKLSNFDEIYFSNLYQYILLAKYLYPNAKWIITDEGCGSKLARSAYLNYDRVDKIIMHNYLNKLDFFGLSKENMNKIVPINKQIFDNVCQECAQKFPVNLNINKDEKAIVFCGSWWEITGLSEETYMKLQDSIIERLTNMGYTILFKAHPRDPRNYINNPNIKILNTTLPLECYKLDIVAVISMGSSASLHSPYISNVAGFSIDLPIDWENPLEQKWLDLLVKKLIKEYTTPIEELFSVNPKLYSKEELRQILLKKCTDFINSKPLLSQNKELENFALSKGYKFNYKEINNENSSYSRL